MTQALISYTSSDRPKADKLRAALTAAGIDVWWDQKLIPGSTFPRVIADEIDAAACTLVLCSSTAMDSRWVLAEANYAGTKVIPIIAEADVKLIPPLNVVEGARLLDWDQSPPAPEFNLLLEKIRSAIAARPAKDQGALDNFTEICRREHIRSWGWLLHEELRDRWGATSVPPPLREAVHQFLTDEPWHAWVSRKLEDAKTAAGADPELVSLLKDISSVDCSDDYPAILAGIRKAASDKNEKSVTTQLAKTKSSLEELKRRAADPKRADGETAEIIKARARLNDERERLESLQRDLWALGHEARDPEFRRCLLVAGFPGSGKTHLIASILDERMHGEQDPSALILVLGDTALPSMPIDQILLDEVRRATRHNWISLEEFSRFLEDTYEQTQVVFVVDNLERWQARKPGFAESLADVIYRSNFRYFRWIITLNPARYDEVSRNAELWRELAWRRSWDDRVECANLSGWLDLDQANRTKETGLRIIRDRLTEQTIALDYLNKTERDETVARNLASPFLAWVMLELKDKLAFPLDQALSLNFVEFIEKFQSLRIAALDEGYEDLVPRQFEQAIWLIAELMARTGELQPFFNQIQDYFTKKTTEGFELGKADVAEKVIIGLSDMNLLALIVDRDQGSRRRVEPRFESFWQFHLARRIAGWEEARQQQFKAFVDLLEAWFGVTQGSVISAEGVLEFLLLQITSRLRNNDPLDQFQRALWVQPLIDDKLPSAAPWFAGPKAPRQAQQVVADWASQGGAIRENRRDLFGLMHFCAEARSEVLTLPRRLRLLQPRFSQIRAGELQSYFLYIVRRLFPRSSDADELKDAMLCLTGCEVLDSEGPATHRRSHGRKITEDLAAESENAVENVIHGVESRIDFIMDFLHVDAARAEIEANAYRQKYANKADMKERNSDVCYFYREWLIREFLRQLVDAKGVESFDLLDNRHWFRPEWAMRRSPTAFYMKRELNFALGHWYQTRYKEEDREEFVDLVRRLVKRGSARLREIAFYLIRHSTATARQERVFVNRVFHPILRAIYLDPKVKVPDGLGQANLADFEDLKQQRLRLRAGR